MILKAETWFDAIKKGDLDTLHQYQQEGFKPDNSGLIVATTYEKLEVVEFLLSLSHIHSSISPNITSTGGMTPLMIASLNNYLDIAKLLIKHNARVGTVSVKDGKSALHYAAQEGYKDMVELLVDSGADRSRTDFNLKTALMLAIEKKQEAVINYFLSIHQEGINSLCMACSIGNLEIIKDLIKRKVGINEIDHEGESPLLAACIYSGRLDIIGFLLMCGADPHLKQPGRENKTVIELAPRKIKDTLINWNKDNEDI